MTQTRWLIDKSALLGLPRSPDAAKWAHRIERGQVRISTVTLLDLGRGARSADDLRLGLRTAPVSHLPVEYLTPAIENRAGEVQQLLADRGQHRSVSAPHLLLIAAAAELASLTVLHVDKDFELIAELTGQPVERLV